MEAILFFVSYFVLMYIMLTKVVRISVKPKHIHLLNTRPERAIHLKVILIIVSIICIIAAYSFLTHLLGLEILKQ